MANDPDRDLPIPLLRQGATARSSWLLRHCGLQARMGALLVIVIGAAACHSSTQGNPPSNPSNSTSPPASRCRPHGAGLRITASGNRFDQPCLAARADTRLEITLDNQDQGVVHNLAIYSNSQRTRTLFRGRLFQGVATAVYQVPPLPAGTYYFQCDVHPQTMTGTLVVG